MRILVLTNLYPPHYVGGYELRCRDVTEALQKRGHAVTVLTSNHKLPEVAERDLADCPVERSLRIHGFFGHPWLTIPQLRKLEEHNNARVLEAVAAFRPDVVHVWNLGGISKSLAFTLQRLGIPTVYDVSDHWIARSLAHDVWLSWWNRESLSPMARLARGAFTVVGKRRSWNAHAPMNTVHELTFPRIYFCSKKLRQITEEAGYPVAHGAVIHCPVDTLLYHGEVSPATQPLRRLLYAGRLSADKGILTALQAMREIKDRSNLSLSVYGKGDEDYVGILKSYVAQHQLPVTFHSATPSKMPEVYRSHDALLFTSEWEEPFALTPLEAMASGLAVIGTTTGGSAELLIHGVNSLTFEAGNAGALASQIRDLEKHPEVRERLASAGQVEVGNRLKQPMIVDQIERYLMDTVAHWAPVSLNLES